MPRRSTVGTLLAIFVVLSTVCLLMGLHWFAVGVCAAICLAFFALDYRSLASSNLVISRAGLEIVNGAESHLIPWIAIDTEREVPPTYIGRIPIHPDSMGGARRFSSGACVASGIDGFRKGIVTIRENVLQITNWYQIRNDDIVFLLQLTARMLERGRSARTDERARFERSNLYFGTPRPITTMEPLTCVAAELRAPLVCCVCGGPADAWMTCYVQSRLGWLLRWMTLRISSRWTATLALPCCRGCVGFLQQLMNRVTLPALLSSIFASALAVNLLLGEWNVLARLGIFAAGTVLILVYIALPVLNHWTERNGPIPDSYYDPASGRVTLRFRRPGYAALVQAAMSTPSTSPPALQGDEFRRKPSEWEL